MAAPKLLAIRKAQINLAIHSFFRNFAPERELTRKKKKIMTVFTAIVAFVVVALIGWAIAECKDKIFCYENGKEEEAVLQNNAEQLRKNGYSELDINDVMRMIATTGYSAV